MPSEDDVKPGHSNGNVTSPFVTETYRCVATYETKDTKNKAFKVDVDEKVDVLIKDKAGECSSCVPHQLVAPWLVSFVGCPLFRLVAGGEGGQADGLVPGTLPGEAGR